MPMPVKDADVPKDDQPKKIFSCSDCPSLMTRKEASLAYGRDMGGEVCVRRGVMLGNMLWDSKQKSNVRLAYGSTCEFSGMLRPDPSDYIGTIEGQVAEGSDEALLQGRQLSCQTVESCSSCYYFVPGVAVRNEFGWTSPLCTAQGRLLLDRATDLKKNAQQCHDNFGYAKRQQPGAHQIKSLVNKVKLLPIYRADFKYSGATPVSSWIEAQRAFDPNLYETDIPVSQEDAESGIRAWREVPDPDGVGETVYHPIFRRDFFTAEEQATIPFSGSDSHPELYVDSSGLTYAMTVAWFGLDYTPFLIGDSGVGKTELCNYMAWAMQVPFVRISIDNTTETESLKGKWTLEPVDGQDTPQMVWVNGRLSESYERVCVCCIDEANCGAPEIDQTLRPLTDNSKQLVLDEKKGEVLTRNDFTMLAMTGNPPWDPKYIGVNDWNDASMSRVLKMWIDLPDPDIERDIIKKRCEVIDFNISDQYLDLMAQVALEIRGSIATGLPISWGLRSQIMVAQALRYFTFPKAYNYAVGNGLEPETREVITGIVSRVTAHLS